MSLTCAAMSGEIRRLLYQRVLPIDLGKAREIAIGGMHGGAVFQRERGDLGVGHEVAAGAGFGQEAANGLDVAWPGDEKAHRRAARALAIRNELNAYELITVPVPLRNSANPNAPTRPFHLLRRRDLDKSPRLSLSAERGHFSGPGCARIDV